MIVRETSEIALREMSLDEYTDVFSESVHEHNRGRTTGLVDMAAHGINFYCGIESNDQARNYLRHGWHEGVKRLLALKSKIELPPAQDRKRRMRRGDDGESLDIDQAMAGQWDTAWWQARRTCVAGNPTIDIVAMAGGTAARSADELFWSGATAVVLVDALEEAGYSVRLLAGTVAQQDSSKLAGVFVTLKDAGEALRSDVVAAVMCHGGMHRTHMFRSRLTLPMTISDGMGSTRGWDYYGLERAVRGTGFIDDASILLTQTYSLDDCRAQVQQVIARLQGGS